MSDELLTLEDASKILGYGSYRYLYRRVKKMGIPIIKKDGRIFVKISDVYGSCSVCKGPLPKGRTVYCCDKCMRDSFKSVR